jgi:predicted transglutaminase-like cysteine proteinase
MVLCRLVLSTVGLAGTLFGVATPAQAAVDFSLLPSAAFAVQAVSHDCRAPVAPALGTVATDLGTAPSKAAAILGGEESALERIAREQAGLGADSFAAAREAAESHGLAPASGGAACAGFIQPRAATIAGTPGLAGLSLGAGDYLASRRLAIGRTGFDKAWDRVRSDGLSRREARQLARAVAGQGTGAQLAAVNSWTNSNVRYVEDRELYGQPDFWAAAGTTLRRRAGDCEDIAIAKMQLLAAMGFDRSDMYLVVARDTARNADHAMLVVRAEGQFWLLDNNTDRVLDARESYDYRPIMSFSGNRKWLHGY